MKQRQERRQQLRSGTEANGGWKTDDGKREYEEVEGEKKLRRYREAKEGKRMEQEKAKQYERKTGK